MGLSFDRRIPPYIFWLCHASYFGHCRPFIFIKLPWEIILAVAVDSAMSFAIGFRAATIFHSAGADGEL